MVGVGVAAILLLAVGAGAVLFIRNEGRDEASDGTPALSSDELRAAVESFDPSLNARAEVGLINAAARQDREALRAVALEQLSANNPEVRWAALYALSVVVEPGDSEGIAALEEFLVSTDVDERLAAASGLVVVGEKAAVPVLITLLESTETTEYVVMPTWRIARGLLLAHVMQDLGLRGAENGRAAAAAKPAWQSWWDERGASLTWDTATGTFR
jgi:hypothetical protein